MPVSCETDWPSFCPPRISLVIVQDMKDLFRFSTRIWITRSQVPPRPPQVTINLKLRTRGGAALPIHDRARKSITITLRRGREGLHLTIVSRPTTNWLMATRGPLVSTALRTGVNGLVSLLSYTCAVRSILFNLYIQCVNIYINMIYIIFRHYHYCNTFATLNNTWIIHHIHR